MLETLKTLCEINGTSGREEKVREYIISCIDGKCDWKVDPMGNILAFKKGKKTPKNKVMLSAHMDEVGFIVTYITDDGYLKFAPVGGIDSKVIIGRSVTVGEHSVPGVIGIKPIHMTNADEKGKVPSVSEMCIDIGASTKEEAEKYVEIGDSAYFISDFEQFGNNKVKAKAIDDRFGCTVMLGMLDSDLEYDAWFAFLVQEEVGLRGAAPAAFSIAPDYAIVLESTTAADVSGVSGADCVCQLGEGAVVSFMDRSTVYNRELFKGAFKIANENGIKCQTKTAVAGGNDAGAIHKSNGGIYTITISLPCRYIHSATSVADINDMQSCCQLAAALFKEYANA
ncbi:MAG: M42 family metallopeptidase [Faecalibacterium sp.]|nr:M42 family metallopeptidase [Ruminococcus sp.]MCM1392248.1 M42 family metallopeptidase [Ruminococcus sp.]MCM1484951.1 M42 family metallopeptidase [Faecalibacterium sp.]